MLRSLLCLLALAAAAPLHAEEEFVELFNGKNLDGWKGDAKVWSVEEGLLTGKSPEAKEDKLKANTFAIWDGGEVGDFELIAEFRLEGDNNSGVQYRAQPNPKNGPFSIVGYQADIHPAANYTGMLYDEGGRGIAAERGQKVTLKSDDQKEVKPLDGKFDPVDLSEWTTIEVQAVGNRLIHKINGDVAIDVTDEDPKNAEAKGLLALQVHAGPDMKVQYRSIKLKDLSKASDKSK
jgi:hypothetical protein